MPRKRLEPLTPATQAPLAPSYNYYGFIPCLPDEPNVPDVYDGDTCSISVDAGLENWESAVYYRLLGIQAPEIRPLKTREAATASRDHLRLLIRRYSQGLPRPPEWLGDGFMLMILTHKSQRSKDYRPKATRGKFGRYLVELIGVDPETKNPVNLNKRMLADGFATPYQA